jgi:hypothetical protein
MRWAEHGHVHGAVLVTADEHLPFDEEDRNLGEVGDRQRQHFWRVELTYLDQPGFECFGPGQECRPVLLHTCKREDTEPTDLQSVPHLYFDFKHLHDLAPFSISSDPVWSEGVTVTRV